jgi:hypothetical protein
MAKCGCPGLAVRAMVGWRRRPAWDEALWLTTATGRLGCSLQALARETPLPVEDLERRALIRQGYRAALRWPLVPQWLGSGWAASSWAAAAE